MKFNVFTHKKHMQKLDYLDTQDDGFSGWSGLSAGFNGPPYAQFSSALGVARLRALASVAALRDMVRSSSSHHRGTHTLALSPDCQPRDPPPARPVQQESTTLARATRQAKWNHRARMPET